MLRSCVILSLLFVFVAVTAGSSCSTTNCTQYSDCTSCANGNCYWCGSTDLCLPANAGNSGPCDPTQCASGCFKGSSSYCPTVPRCNVITNCTACTEADCYWCGTTQTCLEATISGAAPCWTNVSCGSGCWKGSDSYCPSVASCSSVSDCKSCTDANCYWCAATATCSEATISGASACGGPACASGCWKGSDSYCPLVKNCSAITNCTGCADADCYWCGSTRTCQEPTISGASSCSGGACTSGCWKGSDSYCPTVVDCSTINNCTACADADCYWCGSTHTCHEATISGASSCDGEACTSGCWKGSDSYCPKVEYCSTLTNCSSCTDADCYWCAGSQSCHEATVSGASSCDSPVCVGAGCWKGSDSYCPAPVVSCSGFSDCRSCTNNDNCGWCEDTKTCYEASVSGAAPCNATCNLWAVGTCDAICNSLYTNCSSCQASTNPIGCGWCSGMLNYVTNLLGSHCVATLTPTDKSRAENYACAVWHNETCPDCASYNSSCATCIGHQPGAQAGNCGWAKLKVNNVESTYCLEGNGSLSFQITNNAYDWYYSSCADSQTTAVPTVSSSTYSSYSSYSINTYTVSSSSSSSTSHKPGKKLSTGELAGIIGGVVVVVAIAVGASLWFFMKRRRAYEPLK